MSKEPKIVWQDVKKVYFFVISVIIAVVISKWSKLLKVCDGRSEKAIYFSFSGEK